MDNTRFLAPAVLVTSMWLQVLYADCPYRECFCSGTIIMCDNNHLQFMPGITSINVTGFLSFGIENNQITLVPAGRLPPGLKDISFINNPVSGIDDTAFDGSANTLTSLEFSNTQFTEIPNALGHLQALTYLSIVDNNNKITNWNDDVMKILGHTMETLDLENVGMTTWPTWIRYFSRLSELTLAGNSISYIPDNALDSVIDSLQSLSLYSNRLAIVPKALFRLPSLQMLYLHQNQISDLSWLPHSSALTSLSLSDNNISDAVQLSQSLRPFSDSLMSLDIDKNHLTSIPDFSYFTKIGSLDFSNNKISDPNSGSAPSNLYELNLAYNYLPSAPQILLHLLSVTDISLSWNSIKAIQATDFHSHTQSIDLGYNLISELTDSSFPPNSSILYLQLNNNPLIRISTVALQNLPNLIELNLKYTKLTRLPLALNLLTKLNTLDVRNSTDLVCTCMERGLTAWLIHLRQEYVLGDCGQTSVYNFFTTLSYSCP